MCCVLRYMRRTPAFRSTGCMLLSKRDGKNRLTVPYWLPIGHDNTHGRPYPNNDKNVLCAVWNARLRRLGESQDELGFVLQVRSKIQKRFRTMRRNSEYYFQTPEHKK